MIELWRRPAQVRALSLSLAPAMCTILGALLAAALIPFPFDGRRRVVITMAFVTVVAQLLLSIAALAHVVVSLRDEPRVGRMLWFPAGVVAACNVSFGVIMGWFVINAYLPEW